MRVQRGRWMFRSAMIVAVGAMMTVAGGCGGPKTSADSLAYVTPDEAMVLVKGKGRILAIKDRVGLWIDPRTDREYEAGHIPGALHLPYQSLSEMHQQVIGDADLVVVYGNGYNDVKAEGMSKRLIELGYKKVHTLQGGIRAWTDAGLELETDGT